MSYMPALSTTAALLAVLLLLPASPVQAAVFSSVYSSTADKDCRKTNGFKIEGDDYASERVCPGPKGFVVLKQEDDMRGDRLGRPQSQSRSAGAGCRPGLRAVQLDR